MPDGNRTGSGCSLPSASRDFAIQQSSLRTSHRTAVSNCYPCSRANECGVDEMRWTYRLTYS